MQRQSEYIHETIDCMIGTDRLHRAVCDRELAVLGLHRAQHRMLMHLYFHGDVPSQRALARELSVTPTVITVTLQKLEAEGYVVRRTVAPDKRLLGVELTAAGRSVVEKTKVILDRVDCSMFRGFTDEELKMARNFYDRMRQNLSEV